MLEAWACSTPI